MTRGRTRAIGQPASRPASRRFAAAGSDSIRLPRDQLPETKIPVEAPDAKARVESALSLVNSGTIYAVPSAAARTPRQQVQPLCFRVDRRTHGPNKEQGSDGALRLLYCTVAHNQTPTRPAASESSEARETLHWQHTPRPPPIFPSSLPTPGSTNVTTSKRQARSSFSRPATARREALQHRSNNGPLCPFYGDAGTPLYCT